MRSDSGTIFIDTMIAAATIAMAVGTLYQVIGDTARRDGAAEDKRMALLVAQSELAAVGYEIPIEPAGVRGTTGPYGWRVAMSPWNGGLWQVTVSVSRGEKDLVSLQTLRTGPAK